VEEVVVVHPEDAVVRKTLVEEEVVDADSVEVVDNKIIIVREEV